MKGMLKADDWDYDESPINRGNRLSVDYRGLLRID